jgi:hypothetical protein
MIEGARDGPRGLSLPRAAELDLRVLAWTAAPVALLFLARLLPAEGAGLALRLFAAGAIVLLLPGALILRVLGRPSSPGVAAAGALALSLLVVFVALVLTVLAGASIDLAVVVLCAAIAAAAVPAALAGRSSAAPRAERRAALGLLAATLPLSALVWWSAGPVQGDGLFHVARVRKLVELDSLTSLAALNEFRDGSVHPGYAVPLWHEALALVARLADVDAAQAALYLPAVLIVPLTVLVAHGAGTALFKHWAGGVAVALALVAQLWFSRAGGTGNFEFLYQPAALGRTLLATAILALAFSFVFLGDRRLLVPLVAAGFALAVVHATYAPYVALLLVGCAVARLVMGRRDEGSPARTAVTAAAVLVPFGLFLLWLLPIATDDPSQAPDPARRAFEIRHYGNAFDVFGDVLRFAPEAIARGGPVVVAGLLAVPLAGLAARRMWAAFVLGGSLAVLAVLLVPWLFTELADLLSLSQARRLAAFLPVPFAIAGAAVLLGRLRLVGVALAAAAALALAWAYPGEFTYRVREGGPGWTVWLAVAGGLVALAAGALTRRRGPEPGRWAAFAAAAFLVPLVALGLDELERGRDPLALPPAAIAAVQANVEPGDVLFGRPQDAYRIAAYSPVYVNAEELGHAPATARNRPSERYRDAQRFFAPQATSDAERAQLLEEYGADWLLVDKRRRVPEAFLAGLELVYDGPRYGLYRVSGN